MWGKTKGLEHFTFIYGDDVWVAEWWHDLDFPADVNQVLLIFDLLFSNGLNGNLEKENSILV